MKLQTTTKDGVRFSTAKAFLTPALSRPNLHILTKATATKVLLKASENKL
jgi:choline dehydrogenase